MPSVERSRGGRSSTFEILQWPENPNNNNNNNNPSSSSPVRVSATNDSSASAFLAGAYETPTNRPSIRTYQAAGGVSSIQFGAQLTQEEAESLQKRRPGSESKRREMVGSGIFSMEAGTDTSTPIPQDKTPQAGGAGVSQIAFGMGERVEGSTEVHVRKPVSIPEVAKQRELIGNLESEQESTSVVRRPRSTAKAKELEGSDIFGPAPDLPPRCLGRFYAKDGDSSPMPAITPQKTPEPKIPEPSITKRPSVKVSNPAGGHSQITFGEETPEVSSGRKVHNEKKMAELSGNNIFHSEAGTAFPAEKHISAAKLKEMTGSDIFKDEKPVIRECLGGIRQAPGGDSSLTLV